MQPLSQRAVRDWAGDTQVGKGRPYADTAVVGATRHAGRGELAAQVWGTRARPYQVTARLAGGRVIAAECSCPVGQGGKCKHVAAVLLAYADDPDRFPDLDVAERELEARDDLPALVAHLLACAPELRPQLAVPMPGSGRPVTTALFRALAADVIRSARQHDEWTEFEVADGLRPLVALLHGYEPADAATAARGIAAALADGGLGADHLADAFAGPFWRPLADILYGADGPPEPPPF